jgi:hypothetical protein
MFVTFCPVRSFLCGGEVLCAEIQNRWSVVAKLITCRSGCYGLRSHTPNVAILILPTRYLVFQYCSAKGRDHCNVVTGNTAECFPDAVMSKGPHKGIGDIRSGIPLFVDFHWRPRETVKMTSNECCDDVWWRAYLGTSQRNHRHQCSKSLPRAALLYILPRVLAVDWSLHFRR